MQLRRFFVLALAAAIAAASMGSSARAATGDAVMAPVRKFVAAFNRSDVAALTSSCTSQAQIIDDFAPHVWSGSGACAAWMSAYADYAKTSGITKGVVTLGKPWHADVTGNRAYVVVPATFAYEQNGKPVAMNGSVMTLALRKTAGGWLIAGWAWADGP